MTILASEVVCSFKSIKFELGFKVRVQRQLDLLMAALPRKESDMQVFFESVTCYRFLDPSPTGDFAAKMQLRLVNEA